MKRVSIRLATINAIEQSDENLSRYPNQMLKWAKYIEQEIGSLLGYKVKAETFTIEGSYLDLPADCFKVIGLVPGDYEDVLNIQYRDITNVIIQEETIVGADVYDRDLTKLWLPEETTWVKNLFWEEIGDQLHVIQDYTSQDMTLIYTYIETDQKGYWIVNESHIDAITKYILYMYAKKYYWKIFKSGILLRQGHIATLKDLERDYNIAVRHARASDGKESPFETRQY